MRNRASDGWIGDTAHSSRTSDHNPNSAGVVTALDITNDPAHGVDGQVLSRTLIQDPRVKYVIWNRKIWAKAKASQGWRAYTGKNPHTKHVHVSVLPDKAKYDAEAGWKIGVEQAAEATLNVPPEKPKHTTLRLKDQGGEVFDLQSKLGVKIDGDFGPKTEAAVKAFQKAHKLGVDGIVGPYTWDALDAAKQPVILNKTTGKPAALMATPYGPETGIVPSAEEDYGSPKWAVSYLQELGWSLRASVALVANLIWESGGKNHTINWSAHGDRGEDGVHHSHGAAQWNDRHGRWQGYVDFAEKNGTAWDDPATQLKYMDKELRSTERKVGMELEDPSLSLAEAMKYAIGYWRPGVPHADKRTALAEWLWQEEYDHDAS